MSGDDEKKIEETTPEDVLLSRLESLIFIFPEPITVRRLAKLLSLEGKRVRELLVILQDHYSDRGVVLVEVGGGFQFQTNAANADVVKAAIKIKPLRLSRAALETLAIVAYRQPLTKADVEDVRRVDCGGTLKFLFEKGLLRTLGRKEEPGRPIIYGTSNAFLELFGLKSLSDLPSLHEFSELWDEHQDLLEEQEFPASKALTPEEAIKKAADAMEKQKRADDEKETESGNNDTTTR